MALPTLPSRASSVILATQALLLGTLLLAMPPALAAPCAGFIDVDDTSAFCTSVTWIHNRGITLGCTANQYCPDAAVTRLQMAAFMNRLGNVTLQQGGNAFGATAVLGTRDNQIVDIRASNNRVMRYDPTPHGIPNLIGGHQDNIADGGHVGQTVGGGYLNVAGNHYATLSGGNSNSAQGEYASLGGGLENDADGRFAAIPGGYRNKAIGRSSFVAGREGIAAEEGMFVWSDSRNLGLEFNPALHRAPGHSVNTFNVRATGVGGVWFVTQIHPTTGVPAWACYAQSGSGWTCTSDRHAKRNLEPIDGAEVLAKLAAMPIYRWQPKDGPNAEIKHFGPMAQDFHATFGLGDSDKSIGFQDADGVALAAIQGLNAKLETKLAEKNADLADMRRRYESDLGELRRRYDTDLADLRRAVDMLVARALTDTALAQGGERSD